MSDVFTNMYSRRSIRNYKSDMVPREIIEKIIEAGRYAPNGIGRQSSIIVAITDKKVRDELAEDNRAVGGWAEGFDPFYGAPVVLVVLDAVDGRSKGYDGCCIMENMMLAAHELGIGSCWIHRAKQEFEMPKWKEWLKGLGVEGEYEGVGHCILGYVEGEYPEAAERKEGRVFWV